MAYSLTYKERVLREGSICLGSLVLYVSETALSTLLHLWKHNNWCGITYLLVRAK